MGHTNDLKNTIQTILQTEMNKTSDRQGSIDNIATGIANGVVCHIQAILKEVLSAGVVVPQDGGASLKTTMLTKLNTII